MLQEILFQADMEAFKDYKANYYASLPLYQNSEKLPELTIPDWLTQSDEDEEDD